jgi:hypothetical protein
MPIGCVAQGDLLGKLELCLAFRAHAMVVAGPRAAPWSFGWASERCIPLKREDRGSSSSLSFCLYCSKHCRQPSSAPPSNHHCPSPSPLPSCLRRNREREREREREEKPFHLLFLNHDVILEVADGGGVVAGGSRGDGIAAVKGGGALEGSLGGVKIY